jgi:hypothetical protein
MTLAIVATAQHGSSIATWKEEYLIPGCEIVRANLSDFRDNDFRSFPGGYDAASAFEVWLRTPACDCPGEKRGVKVMEVPYKKGSVGSWRGDIVWWGRGKAGRKERKDSREEVVGFEYYDGVCA